MTGGPTLKTDLVEVFVFRRDTEGGFHWLQLLRNRDPSVGTWQPVMGRIEPGETAIAAAVRELREETALDARSAVGFWSAGVVEAFYLAERELMVLPVSFAIEVAGGAGITLNHEHADWRWVPEPEVSSRFLWPSQHRMIAHLEGLLRDDDRATLDGLRVSIEP